jgi:hypothetical protein
LDGRGDKEPREDDDIHYKQMVKDSPGGAIAALYMAALFVYEGLVLAQTLLILKKVPWSRQTFGRLSGLGTSGWRGALSAEGVKSSVQAKKMRLWHR